MSRKNSRYKLASRDLRQTALDPIIVVFMYKPR